MQKEKWTASVQYDDLLGTAAADEYGDTLGGLIPFLKAEGVDTSKYTPMGLAVDIAGRSFEILCRHNEAPENPRKKIVAFAFKDGRDLEKLERILKRFRVVLWSEKIHPEDYDWSDIDTPVELGD